MASISLDLQTQLNQLESALSDLPDDVKGPPGANQRVQTQAQLVMRTLKSPDCYKNKSITDILDMQQSVKRIVGRVALIAEKGGFQRKWMESSTKEASEDACKALDKFSKETTKRLETAQFETAECSARLFNISKEDGQSLIDGIREEKILAHLGDVANTKDALIYESSSHGEQWAHLLAQALDTLTPKLELYFKKHKKELIRALESAQQMADLVYQNKPLPEEMIQRACAAINNKELFILPIGYRGHAMTMIFCNGFAVICDRCTYFADPRPTFEIIPFSYLYPEDIRAIAMAKAHSAYWALQFLNQLMCDKRMPYLVAHPSSEFRTKRILEAKPLIPKAVLQSAPPHQLVGNCAYASMEGAMFAAVAQLRIKDNLDPNSELPGYYLEAEAKTGHYMPAFLLHLKLSKLEEYLKKNQGHYDHYLVEQFCKNVIPKLEAWNSKEFQSIPLPLSNYPEVEKFWK